MKHFNAVLIFFILCSFVYSAEFITEKNISWLGDEALIKADEYQKERCCLDIRRPKNGRDLATLVWFHGGGLSSGSKHFPTFFDNNKMFKEGHLIIIAVGYRLHPKVDFPVFLEDAAAAVSWVHKNICRYGGDPNKIFVSGGSAGGYLTAMLGMDPRWLAKHNMKPTDLCGLLPVSGQMTTHFNVKKWLKYPGSQYQPVIDENSPLGHLSADNIPPVFLIVGDRKLEWKARVEENELLYASLKALGHPLTEFSESAGIGHGIAGMGKNMNQINPALNDQINDFIVRALELKKKKTAQAALPQKMSK